MPNRPAVTRAPLALPCMASRARASTGSPSLAKLFQSPETITESVLLDRENPHEPSML